MIFVNDYFYNHRFNRKAADPKVFILLCFVVVSIIPRRGLRWLE